jgi:hypothetical protein
VRKLFPSLERLVLDVEASEEAPKKEMLDAKSLVFGERDL